MVFDGPGPVLDRFVKESYYSGMRRSRGGFRRIFTFGEVFDQKFREVGVFPGATAPGNTSEGCWERFVQTDSTEFALRTPHARRSDANFLILEGRGPPPTRPGPIR